MKKIDRIGLQSGFLVFVTLILHSLAGGQVPNVLIIFLIWLIFLMLGSIFYKFFKTINGSLTISLISQPFLHFIFEKTAVGSNVSCLNMNNHSSHLSNAGCSELASSVHSHSGSLGVMVLFHVFAIFLIQILTILTFDIIEKTKIFISRVWNFVVQTKLEIQDLNLLRVFALIPINLYLLGLVLKNSVIRRGPPLFS